MLLLMLFALLAGAGTAITPCVLPVVPALLSASALGRPAAPGRDRARAGRDLHDRDRRPGPAGQGRRAGQRRRPDAGRRRAARLRRRLLFPALAERVQAPLSRLARFGPRTRGTGFWSGLGVGGALGFVCAPCAGPILAAVTSVSASGGASARVVAVALAYARRSGAVMLLYGLGGRAVLGPDPPPGPRPRGRAGPRGRPDRHRRGDGHQPRRPLRGGAGPGHQPARLPRRPDPGLENSGAVQNRLASLRPASRFAAAPEPGRGHARVPTGARRGDPGRADARRCPAWARPRSSPTPSAGSTPRAAGR